MGVYGYTEEGFFYKLKTNKINVFIDIRRRRGMRGSKYAFVNSIYLQKELKSRDIQYIYVKELSPTQDVRETQKEVDKRVGNTKQNRVQLSQQFIERYSEECLANFDLVGFIDKLDDNCNVLFFCVEEHPEACHRSLITQEMQNFPGVIIHHIVGK